MNQSWVYIYPLPSEPPSRLPPHPTASGLCDSCPPSFYAVFCSCCEIETFKSHLHGTGPSFEGCTSNWIHHLLLGWPCPCSTAGPPPGSRHLRCAHQVLVLCHKESLYVSYQLHKKHSQGYVMIQELLKKNLAQMVAKTLYFIILN